MDEDGGLYLAELAATLASHGGGSSSGELALDLILNEIVEQACLATNATGAAIALARGEHMVCRATTGANAPDLGVRLNLHSGLSGASVQTREVQHCTDTETDPRVDAAACRRLDVRSILVVPILDDEKLLGVFEIFSAHPDAFGERDILTVKALSRRIVDGRRHAEEAIAAPTAAEPISPELALEAVSPAAATPVAATPVAVSPVAVTAPPLPEIPPPRIGIDLRTVGEVTRPRDYWTGILTAVVVVLALLLGWMVGRAGWTRTTTLVKAPSAAESSPPQPQIVPPSTSAPNPPSAVVIPSADTRESSKPVAPKAAQTRPQPAESPVGGLTVYEKGKLIFKVDPVRQIPQADAPPAARGTARAASNSSASGLVQLSPEVANAYLIGRVEPQYPEPAREQQLQGAVVLDALIGPEGTVRDVKVVSGDSLLSAAAVAAVQHWRYRPYQANGQPVPFTTRVTVNFTLP